MFKAKMVQDDAVIEVAVKELMLKEETEALYDFQHEITIMR